MRIGRRAAHLAILILLLVLTGMPLSHPALGADDNHASQPKEKVPKDAELALVQTVMCESVQNLKPINESLAFSVSLGHVYCVSSFKPVPKPTVIFHRWYRRNELSTQIRLKVYPPHWTTYSVIQLREEDKGPWHIEVTDQNGKIFDIIRFSITD